MWMIEEFCELVLLVTRGNANPDRPQDAGKHPHRDKWKVIRAWVADRERVAQLHLLVDLWKFYSERHAFCLRRSVYGDFAPSHHRHEMAVQVCEAIVWYRRARADPEAAVFWSTSEFLSKPHELRFKSLLPSDKRALVRERMARALAAGEESLLTWSAKVWTRAVHLLGAVCDERYRVGVAQLVLILVGEGNALGARARELSLHPGLPRPATRLLQHFRRQARAAAGDEAGARRRRAGGALCEARGARQGGRAAAHVARVVSRCAPLRVAAARDGAGRRRREDEDGPGLERGAHASAVRGVHRDALHRPQRQHHARSRASCRSTRPLRTATWTR